MNKILKEIIKEYKEYFNESAVIADCKLNNVEIGLKFKNRKEHLNGKFRKVSGIENIYYIECKFIHFRATQTYYNDKFHKKNEEVTTIEIMGC